MNQCSIEECPKQAVARNYCVMHYNRWSRHGDPNFVKIRRWDPTDADVETKTCSRCERRLPLEAFEKRQTSPDGHRGVCKDCRNKAWRERYAEDDDLRLHHLGATKNFKLNNPEEYRRQSRDATRKAHYGVDGLKYRQMLMDQNGLCAICQKPPVEGKSLSVDHDHETGRVRKLLCNSCNVGLGFFQDSIELLQAAIGYLQSSSSPS